MALDTTCGWTGMRIDKWLHAAEFFKSRGLAQSAVESGRVKVNGERCKATRELQPGDRLLITLGEYEWDVFVTALAAEQGPGLTGRELYEEDEDSLARRAQAMEAKKLTARPDGGRQRHDGQGGHGGGHGGGHRGGGGHGGQRPQGRGGRNKQRFRRRGN